MRFLIFPFLLCTVWLRALEFGETHADLVFKPEYHRSFGYCQEFALSGEQIIENSYTVQGGIALGQTGSEFDIDLYLGGAYLFPLPFNLSIRLLYIYNAIPAYTYQTNTLFPFLSLRRKWGGLDLGTAFRFTRFDSAPSAIFEPIFSIRLFLDILTLNRIKLLMGLGNFSPFHVGNLGAYYLFFESRIDMQGSRPVRALREIWRDGPLVSLISGLELYQTGGMALASTFQGLALRWGLGFSW
ncbi:MAG: hypothetical protein LBH51_08205 [Treponema sp.]|jgi:hypothetical protein|nr:hypothetical protein [Treponema sp.]